MITGTSMNQRAFWKYFRDFNFSNIAFSALSGVFFGITSALLIFLTFGTLVGYLGFQYFKSNEYYLYYNLGFSKFSLIWRVWLLNLFGATPIVLIIIFFT